MGSFSVWHWLIVLAVVLLVFGTKKLRNVGSDLGGAVKGFREAMQESRDQPLELAGVPVEQEGQLDVPSQVTPRSVSLS